MPRGGASMGARCARHTKKIREQVGSIYETQPLEVADGQIEGAFSHGGQFNEHEYDESTNRAIQWKQGLA